MVPALRSAAMFTDFYRRHGKRLFDVIASGAALVVLSPALIALAVLVRWRLGSPVLFRQVRPGRDGRPFVLRKFRTMTDARDERGDLLPDDRRLTRFGRFLRASSLDELPELWNVFTGTMSLVGPRPLLMEYLDRYSPRQARRHELRPGLTGWAQINGRNGIDWETRLELDVWYVEHCSPWLDLRILALTVARVVRRDGIRAAGHATMPKFTGHSSAMDARREIAFSADAAAKDASSSNGVIVIGAGGHAKVTIATLRAAGFEIAAAYDDDPLRWESRVLGIPVLGPLARLEGLSGRRGVIGIGNGHVRRELAARFDLEWVTVVHPRAHVAPEAEIGPGTVVFAGAVIQPGTRIGAHAAINTAASVDHDCDIGDFVHVAPGTHVAGNVRVEEGAFLGIGSRVIPGVRIGAWATLGAGGTAIRDLPPYVVAVGTPARIIGSETPLRKAS